MATKKTRHIFFDTIEEAERFRNLYDDNRYWVTIDIPKSYWVQAYFGEKSLGKVHVYFRTDSENLEKIIKSIRLRKCKWAGHLCYYYQA